MRKLLLPVVVFPVALLSACSSADPSTNSAAPPASVNEFGQDADRLYVAATAIAKTANARAALDSAEVSKKYVLMATEEDGPLMKVGTDEIEPFDNGVKLVGKSGFTVCVEVIDADTAGKSAFPTRCDGKQALPGAPGDTQKPPSNDPTDDKDLVEQVSAAARAANALAMVSQQASDGKPWTKELMIDAILMSGNESSFGVSKVEQIASGIRVVSASGTRLCVEAVNTEKYGLIAAVTACDGKEVALDAN